MYTSNRRLHVSFIERLSRSTCHETCGKDPIDFPEVAKFLFDTGEDPTPSIQRNRAMTVVSFFGVRRSAETRNFEVRDVSTKQDDFVLKVRCQKNDQEGLGSICIIPNIRSFGKNSPACILAEWLSVRRAFQRSDAESEPLFITTTGSAGQS